MRLIDADALFKKVPYGDIEHDVKISKCGAIADICTWILTAPTIDAVPVVRCAECKRCFVKETKRHKQPMWICMRGDLNVCVHPHDFCSYGERRSDG
jgi:hypothetical protein